MTKIIDVDPYSLTAVKITMLRDDLELAIGSAFLWQHGETVCLVTAWHCITGTHPVTRKSLSSTGARPNKVKITFCARSTAETYSLFQNLYTDDDGTPAWVIHPLGSAAVDVAAVPLTLPFPADILSQPVNLLVQTSDMDVRVGSDLFILGYPRNIGRLNLPIWKRASLAIDPAALMDAPESRHLLVDTATREGISRGLVIARASGAYPRSGGGSVLGAGSYTKIVGIYSGRTGSQDEFAAQIGMVWPIRYVEEIMTSGVQDDFI